ncbi:MAG: E3 binding domain-containing protein, partial [Bacteroidetes bacterium]|nr:E3 binding domain-containing protein [Bacteroidota bacterium]
MAIPVLMPRQGQSVESCILGQWYKSVGEEVSEGDILFSYETDKASFEEEAKEDGILLATFFEEGDEVPVLVNVAVLGNKGESFDEFKPGGESKEEAVPIELIEEAPKVIEFDVEDTSPNKRIRISPLAKKMAEKLGVDVQTLKGSGPHGRIIARDVETTIIAAETPVAQPTV